MTNTRSSAKKKTETQTTQSKKNPSPVARHTRSAKKKVARGPAEPLNDHAETSNIPDKVVKDTSKEEAKEKEKEPASPKKRKRKKKASIEKVVKEKEMETPSPKKRKRKKKASTEKEVKHPSSKKKEKETPSPKKRKRKKKVSISKTAGQAGGDTRESATTKQDTMQINKDEEETEPVTKPPPFMDVSVHRVRHLNYQPKPIICLATSPFDSQAADYVALSRDNGSVELRCPDEKWRTVATVTGMSSRKVDVMAWTCGVCDEEKNDMTATFSSTFHESHTRVHSRRTLIGASRDGTIFAVNFRNGRQIAVTGSGGGGVFSLVSLCGKDCCKDTCPQLVAAGCQDGSVRIYHVVKQDRSIKLELISTVPCAGTAVLSLAWRRTTKGTQGIGGTVLYAGVADGTIRRLDCVSSQVKERSAGTTAHAVSTGTVVSNENQTWKSVFRMTVESYGRATPTRVWALQALSDGTVISGDSLGHVQFWDGNTGTLLQSFDQNDNKADVLALAVSDNECRVFASGIDSRVICIERPENTTFQKWVMTHAQRPHTHDVKAMAMCRLRDTSGSLREGKQVHEVLCSGGVDTKLCTYAINDFGKVRPKNLYPWPTVSPISVANEARVLAMKRDDRVDLYRLAKSTTVTDAPVLVPEDDLLIGSIEIKGNSNLECADITNDGHLLAVSDSNGLSLFRLEYNQDESGRTTVKPTQVEVARSIRAACHAVKFVSDSQLACASFEGPIRILKVTQDVDSSQLEVASQHTFAAQESNFPVHTLAVSPDGTWLAAVRSGVESGTVQVYSISDGDCKNWWSLSALEAPVSSIRFLGGDEPTLAIACTNCAMYLFDVVKRRLSAWSEKLGVPMWRSLPRELKHRADFPVRFAFNPAAPSKFLLGFFGAFSAIDMDKPMAKHCRMFPETHVRGRKKRKRQSQNPDSTADGQEEEGETAANTNNCTICLRYNSMLYMDFLADNEMLVVEQPWLSVVSSFPEALERKVYGT